MFDPSLDDGKGAKRDPDVYESVRAATRQQQADRDPMAKYTQRLEKVGKTVPGLLAEVEEIDNLAARDPIAGYKKLMNKYGHDPRAVAQHLWNGSSPNGDQAAEQEIANHTIAEFDSRHSDPMSKHLRRMAAKILERGDKRLKGNTHAEMLDCAFALAWHDLPQNKARNGPSEILNARDAARDTATARVQKKMIARNF